MSMSFEEILEKEKAYAQRTKAPTFDEILKSASTKRRATQADQKILDDATSYAKNVFNDYKTDFSALNFNSSKRMSEKYNNYLQEYAKKAENAKNLLMYIDVDDVQRREILKGLDETLSAINKINVSVDFYSQFANEEEYKQSMEFSELSSDEKKAYIEKRKKDAEYFGKILDRYERSKYENYSIDIGESPVAGPQGLIKELEAVGIGTGDLQIVNGDVQKFEEDAYKKYEQIKAEIGSYESTMEALKFAQNVSDFKEKLTTDGLVAEWEQNGSKDYSAHLSNSSEMFEDEKIVYNVLARRAGQIINVYDDGRVEIADGKYVKLYKKQQRKGLTDSEMALQLGVSTKEYKEKVADAAEFVEFKKKLEDYANQRKGIKIAENLDGKLLLQELYGIVSGAETWLSGMQSLVTGESKNSATDYASALIKEDIKSGYGVWSPFWGGAYDTNVSIGQMVPSIAISYVVGGAAGALGASTKGAQLAGNIAFKTSFGGSVYGNAYTEMINAGYKPTQAKTFASLSAASEVFLQDMLGGIGKFSGKLTNVSIKAVADNIDNAFARIAVSGVLEGLGEFTEESLQEILNPIYKSIITGNVEPIDWGNVLYSGILGFATSAVMNGPGYVKQGVSTAISKWKQNEFKITKKGVKLLNVSEEVYSLANSMPEYTTSYKLSEIVRKKGNAYNLVSELAYLEKPITDDVANTIKSNLLNEGYSEEVASGLVNSLKKVSSGGNVTMLQKQAIETNPVLSSLILDAYTKADATKIGIKEQYDNIYSRKETTREAIYDKISSKLGQNTGEMKATGRKALKTRTQNINAPISDVVLSKKKNPELTDSEIAKNKQIIIDVAEALGYKVEFEEQVYTESGAAAQGKIDYESRVIKISETAEKPIAWIFKHEITHSAEKSNNYEQFVDKIAQTDVYNNWLRMQTGLNSSTNAMEKALIKSTINKYSNAGVDLDEPGSRGEIIADFIGDMLFTDPGALQDMLEQLDKPTRNKFVKWILELIDKIKDKFSKGDDKIYNELEALERQFADMLKDVGKENIIDKGIKHSTNDKIIDLSKNNELQMLVNGKYGNEKYKIIQQYILNVLSNQPITLSDGKKVIVDRSDAQHISSNAWDKKTAQISEIKKLIETAKLYAEDKNPTHNKFDYFCYYKADVRYDDEVFSIYLNVGRTINDGSYHLYDITNKIKDTADRINGLGRPKPNEGYALTNGIFTKNIPQNKHSVNDSVENNLSKSDMKYSYAGEKAKTVNMANLQAAVDMEESGKFTVNEIRKATGWFRGYDGKWRFEIDDSKMQVKDVTFKDSGMTLGDIIEHEELFDAYPQLKDIKIEISYDEKFNEKIGATYDPINKKIMLNGRFFDPQGKIWAENEVLFKSTLIHEIQHVIQEIEGFAGGASTAYWEFYKKHQLPSENNGLIELVIEYNTIIDKVAQYNESGSNKLFEYYNLKIDEQPTTMSIKSIEQQKELVECEKALKQLGLENEYQQASLLIDKMNNIYKKMRRRQQRSAEDLYKHTAGEIESEDVENRLEYNKKERYDVSPNIDMPDVVFSEKEDIIRLLKNGNATPDNLQNIEKDASEISERKFSYDELIKKDNFIPSSSEINKKSLFKYTEEQYNNFGWARYENIISHKMLQMLTSKIYELTEQKVWFHKTTDGQYIIPLGEDYGLYDILVYVDDNYENPKISMVIKLADFADEYLKESIWKEFLNESELTERKINSTIEDVRAIYGEESVVRYVPGNSANFQTYEYGRREGITGIENRGRNEQWTSNGNVASKSNGNWQRNSERDISYFIEEKIFNKKTAADLKRSAFSLSDNNTKYSITEKESALKTENEKLKADNKNLRELVNLYKHVAGGEIKIASVDKVARDLIKRNNIKGDKNELMRKLINLYKFISHGEDLSWENIKQKAEPVVKWLQEHVREESKIDEYSRDILSTLRETKVYLDEAQRKEVSAQFGAYGDFRKRLMGSVIIANKENAHTSLNQAWQELAEMYPDVFDAKTAPNDMPGMLFETVQMLRNGDFSVEQEQRYYNEAEKADLLNQVYEGYWDVSDVKTASEIMQNKLDALKIKHAKQMKSLRTDKNKRIESIKAETQNKMREGRKKTETRQKIKRVVNTLNSYLLNGNKNKHVPEWMQPAVAEALDLINMDTIGAQERIDNLRAKLKENLSENERAKIEKSIANIHEMGERLNKRLINLKNAYAEIQAAEDPLLAGSFDEVVENKIQEVIDNVGDTPIRKMTLQQLESVYDMFSMILTRVRDVNKAFVQNQKETITEMGQNVVSEIKSAGGEKEKQRAFVAQIKKFGWDLFKPIYAMRAIGSDTFTKLFQNIINGQGVWARDMEESKKFISHQKKKYGYSKWDFKKTYTFKSRTDSKFNLNLEQIMSIYAYSKRPQAHDHLMKGGITFAKDAITEVKNKMGIVEKYEVNTSKAHNLDPQTIIDIVSVLTEQQRLYVDVMQSYLSDIMGEKGNDVSMKLYGIKLFKEKFYFPLKSANYFITYEAGQTQEKRIKNSGMTKKTVAHANNPIVLDDFSKVWALHVNEMSMYHSFVLPLEDFNRVFNYRTPSTTETETLSVASTLVNAYGNGAEDYIKTLLNDLNGGVRSDGSGLMDKLIGLSKKGAVMASASVVIQQPSAVMRAMAHIDPKYFANMKYWIPKHKEKWNLIKKYAPVAVIKEMGRFDTGMGTGSVEWLMQDVPRNFAEKIEAFFKDGNYRDDVFGRMPSLADEFGWIQIWNAVEKEIAKTRKIRVRSEEFYKAVAERFSEVIELTQVYDSTLSRSGIMRKTDSGAKMLTAFMAEPTTQLNMLMDATIQAKRSGGAKGVKIIAGTTGAIVASMVLNAALKSLVMAARDDDEDETYVEKYISAFTGEVLSSFDILNSVPIAKDIISIFKGYDVERLDMALISDLKNAIYAMDDEKKSTTEKIMDLAGALAAFGGLPVKNVYRDIDSVFNFVETLNSGQKTTKGSIKSAFMEGVAEGHFIAKAFIDTTKTQKLYDAMISDDEVYIDRLKKQYKTEGAFNTALYNGLRSNDERIEDAAHALYEGNTDTYSDFIDEIVSEGHFDKDIVVSAIKSEMRSWENTDDDSSNNEATTEDAGGETSIYDMSDVKMFFDAEKYDAAKTAIQDIMEVKQNKYILQGVKVPDALKKAKSSMRSSMTSYYKEKYIDAYKNKDEAEMFQIRKILTESGIYGSASDVRKTVVSWTKE